MKDNSYMIRIASFLIFLIITLPMNGSLAVAATIHSADAFGRAEIPGFRAMTDITVVNVTATITEDSDIGPGQVKILENPTVPFECSVIDEATALFGCKAELAEVTLSSSTGLLPFTIQIFADNGAPLSPPRQGSLLVDAKPPKIIGDPSYVPLPGGIVEASYEVIDEACDAPACAQRCTGVARVGFSVASLPVGEGIVESADCRQTGKVNLTGLIAGADVQTKHICVEAVDKLGQSATPKCKDVLLDTKPPFISSVGLYDINSKPIIYTNGQPVCNVKIIINLTEDSVLVNPRVISAPMGLILLNASLLSERPDHQALYGNLQAACTKKSANTYECKNDVGACLIVTSARDISIHVEAADQFGNILNESKPLSVKFDNTPPVATKIYTNFSDDKGTYWIRAENTTVSMDITETDSGMSNKYAFIDLSGFGPQIITSSPNLAIPHECVEGWTCRWHWVQTDRASGSSLYLKPMGGSKDDAGNAMTETNAMIKVDKDAPVMLHETKEPGADVYLNVSAMSDMGTTSYVTSGDMVTLKAYVEDHTPIKMFANFSGILPVEGQENVEGTCAEMAADSEYYSAFLDNKRVKRDARLWECVWEVGPVVTVPRDITRLWANTTILFSIEDLLGNKAKEEYHLPILGEENVTANYWKYKWLSQSPTQGLDRFIWGIAQPTSFQHFTIKPAPGAPSGDKLEIISFDFDTTTCSGDIDYVYYSDSGTAGITYMGFSPEIKYGIDDVIMMAFNPTNAPPATYTDLHNVSHPLEELRINCTAKIISKVYGARVSLPEEENVTLKVGVFNNPLGTNIGNVKDEINDVQEHIASAGWGAVKYPRMIFDYAQIACNLVSTIQSVLGVLTFVGILEGSACAEYQVMCGPSSQTNDITGELTMTQKGLLGKISVFCGLVISCRATQPQAIDGTKKTTDADGQPTYECEGDSTWCSFQLWWAEWSNGVISWLSGSALLETNEDLNKYMNQNPSQAETAAGGRNLSGNMPFMTSSDIRGGFDPKKSLIASTLSLCIPGILSNIEKYRQLRCEWLICVKINVAYGDMTLSQCDDLFQYGLCKYILGDIWNAVPMFQFINQLLSSVGNLVKDPIALGGYVIDLLCANSCGGFPGPGCGVCTAFQFMNVLTQIVASIYGMADAGFWTAPTNDICDEAVKDEPKYSNIPGFPPEADPAQQTPPEEDTGAAA